MSASARRAAGNAVVSSAAQVLGKVATLAWTLVAARVLTTGDFGAFFYVLTVAGLVAPLAEWGFTTVMVRRGAAEPDRLRRLFTLALVWQTGVGLPVFLAAGAVVALTRPDAEVRLAGGLLLVSVLVDMVNHTCRAAASARHRQASTSAALVGQRLATAAISIGALLAGGGLVGLAAGQLAGAVVGLALHLRAVSGLDLRLQRSAVDRPALREYARGTLLVGLGALTMMALFRVDSLLLGLLNGDTDVAAYTAAYRLLETVLFIAYALRSVVFPLMSATTSREKISSALEAGTAAMAAVYVAYAAVVLVEGGAILELLFGGPYERASTPALLWLAPAPLLFAVAYLGNAALQSVDRTRDMFAAAGAATVFNIVANLLAIPRYGPEGAAAVTTASFALQCAVQQPMLRRVGVRNRLWRPLAEPVLASAVLAGALLVMDLPVLVELAVGGALYLTVWVLVVRRTDPRQIAVARSIVERRRR